MANGVVKVGRHQYAVGLFWQPSPSGRVAQAAREAASQPGQKADYFCARSATKTVAVPQYGLGQNAQGHRSGQPSLAASLANAQPGSWTGAFRLREGTWVIVVRDDLVAPDGDFLFDNDEAARERLLQEISLGGMQRIYAPDGWAIPGSDPTPLPLLLQDRVDCKLQPVALPIKLIMFGGGGLVLVAALIFAALQWQAQQQEDAERAAQGMLSGMVKQWQWPPADQVYPHVWEERAHITDVLNQCQELFARVTASQFGWQRGNALCKDGTLSWTLGHNDGKTASIMPNEATVTPDLRNAGQSVHGDTLPVRGAESLIKVTEITRLALTQHWPFEFSRLPDDPPKVAPPQDVKDPPPPPPPPWLKRGLHYSGKLPPWKLLGYFDGIPGVIIENAEYNRDGSWTLDATIYEMK